MESAKSSEDTFLNFQVITNFLTQYVSHVVHASYQYGVEDSISYTAGNIVGLPMNYPYYGDFIDTYILPTYGDWWRQMPSFSPEFGCQNILPADNPPIDGFIVVSFERLVYPEKLEIYETFNPGAVARIWAYTDGSQWVLLWDAKVSVKKYREDDATNQGMISRILKPALFKITERTRVLRIEFCTRRLSYMPGFDAIMMYGKLEQDVAQKSPTKPEQSSGSSSALAITDPFPEHLDVTKLPYEILFKIFSYLDLPSLRRVEDVCPEFQSVAVDTHLYREVNLRPHWMLADSSMLTWLSNRCDRLEKLDLSWCGMFNKITQQDFTSFLEKVASRLTHLRLESVEFGCELSTECPNVRELSIANSSFQWLDGFRNLVRLDVSRTSISTSTLTAVLCASPSLLHLNVAGCTNLDMMEIAVVLAIENSSLVSLNAWKSSELYLPGLLALQACTKLEEVDISWCLSDDNLDGILKPMVIKCRRLKKLFVAGLRSIENVDLLAIADYCPDLEQLDILSCIRVTGHAVQAVLTKCTKLKYLDINYCYGMDKFIDAWHENFPHVTIKYGLEGREF